MFWLTRHGAYRGFGSLDEICLVLPAQDAVLVVTAENYSSKTLSNAIWDHLLPALLDATPPAANTGSILRAKLASLHLPVPAGARVSPAGRQIGGKKFVLAANELGVTAVTLNFQDDRCRFDFEDARGHHEVTCGLAEWVENKTDASALNLHRTATAGSGVQAVAGSAAWSSDNTFAMFWQFIETAHGEGVTCTFDGDLIQIVIAKSTAQKNPESIRLTGRRSDGHILGD